jgi:hypothetical protein
MDGDDARREMILRYTEWTREISSPRGSSQSVDELTDTFLRGTYAAYQADGTTIVYTVQWDRVPGTDVFLLTASEETQHDDHIWGPGGTAEAYSAAQSPVINHTRFFLSDGQGFGGIRGNGGARYVIEFFDGRRVVSHDLWSSGIVPPKWRERFPDNARFIRPEDA